MPTYYSMLKFQKTSRSMSFKLIEMFLNTWEGELSFWRFCMMFIKKKDKQSDVRHWDTIVHDFNGKLELLDIW